MDGFFIGVREMKYLLFLLCSSLNDLGTKAKVYFLLAFASGKRMICIGNVM